MGLAPSFVQFVISWLTVSTDTSLTTIVRGLFTNSQNSISLLQWVSIPLTLLLACVWLVARGALIVAADQAETQNKIDASNAWRTGLRKSGALLGIALLLLLPILIGVAVVLGLFGASLLPLILSFLQGKALSNDATTALLGGFTVAFCGLYVLLAGLVIYIVAASFFFLFAERAVLVDEEPMRVALKQARAIVSANSRTILLLSFLLLLLALIPVILGSVFNSINPINNIVISLIANLVAGPVRAFGSVVWTVAYRRATRKTMLNDSGQIIGTEVRWRPE